MMEIDYIDPIKDPRWDAFVEKHEFGWIGHLSYWKKILETNFKHLKGLYIIIKEKNDIIAGLPIYYVNNWFKGKSLVHIPFCTICDPLVSSNEQLDLLLKEVYKIFNENKQKKIEIRTLNSTKYFTDSHYQKSEFFKYHFLSLDKPIDEIWKNFHKTCVRQRINRATESGLYIMKSKSYDDVKNFYKLYLYTKKRLGLPPFPLNFIKSLWNEFYNKGMLDIYLCYYKNKIISGLLLFKYRDRVSVEIAVSNVNFWNLSPNHFLFWEVMKSVHLNNFKFFDFGRTDINNKGLLDFKERWGSKEQNFYYYFQNRGNKIVKEYRRNYKMVNMVLKITPKFLLKIIGQLYFNTSS